MPLPFRSSLEKRDKADESTQWLEMHKKKCQAMSKSVTLRAKAMDPHKSLEEVFKAKLKENRSVSSLCQRGDCLGIQQITGLENGKMDLLGRGGSYNCTWSWVLPGTVRITMSMGVTLSN